MNKDQKIAVAMFTTAAVVSCLVAFDATRKFTKIHEAKRAQISRNAKNETDIMWRAAALIEQRIKAGKYDGKSLKEVMTDFQYYQMVAHNNIP